MCVGLELVNEVLVKHESLDDGGVVLGSLDKLFKVDLTISVLYDGCMYVSKVVSIHSVYSFCCTHSLYDVYCMTW